jgi:hypothetical protein
MPTINYRVGSNPFDSRYIFGNLLSEAAQGKRKKPNSFNTSGSRAPTKLPIESQSSKIQESIRAIIPTIDAVYTEMYTKVNRDIDGWLSTYKYPTTKKLDENYLRIKTTIESQFDDAKYVDQLASFHGELKKEKENVDKMKANYTKSIDLFNSCKQIIRKLVFHPKLKQYRSFVHDALEIINNMINVLLYTHKQFDVAKKSYIRDEKRFNKEIADLNERISAYEENEKYLYRPPNLMFTPDTASIVRAAIFFATESDAAEAEYAAKAAEAENATEAAAFAPSSLRFDADDASDDSDDSDDASDDSDDASDDSYDAYNGADATSRKSPVLVGGLKQRRSKPSTFKYYLKAFKTYSKRKLKTFRKIRNYKKTKRRKH